MFATLKNKIKEETGNEVPAIPVRLTHNRYSRNNTFDSTSSTSIENLSLFEQKDAEINALRLQCNDLNGKLNELTKKYEQLDEDHQRIEKSNTLLEESVKVAQLQKELIYAEQDKIQDFQQQEISKLKSLLNFREQEAIDHSGTIKQCHQQMEQILSENKQLRELDSSRENIQDEFEKLRHSSQIEKNNLSTKLAIVEEQNRHLISKLKIFEDSRIKFTINLSKDEKVQALLQERKLLEQRLEEAHIHLSDIKSTWSAQNLALETQVSRLSRQVAAETTDKRKVLASQDEHVEKIKVLQFELEKAHNEIQQRDNKIKILGEEIDDLSSTLKEIRSESEEEVTFLKSNVKQHEEETNSLRSRIDEANQRLTEHIEQSDQLVKSLHSEINILKEDTNELNKTLEMTKNEHRITLLKNAEISQDLARLRQQYKDESTEVSELGESLQKLQQQLNERDSESVSQENKIKELNEILLKQSVDLANYEELNKEMAEKNKTIKVLRQRLVDVKKTLQHELKSNNTSIDLNTTTNNGGQLLESLTNENGNRSPIVMDEANFKYLKHVILKFLTCREVEAKHLIRAVSTLLHLSQDEEKLLQDTISFKMSWFGSRPESKILRNFY